MCLKSLFRTGSVAISILNSNGHFYISIHTAVEVISHFGNAYYSPAVVYNCTHIQCRIEGDLHIFILINSDGSKAIQIALT